jgi:hypothetical protein
VERERRDVISELRCAWSGLLKASIRERRVGAEKDEGLGWMDLR